MRNHLLITTCLLASLTMSAHVATDTEIPVQTRWGEKTTEAQAYASSATVTVKSTNSSDISEIYAIGLVAEDGTPYPASEGDNGYSVSVPQGKYTVVYLAKGYDSADYYYGTIENEQVSGDKTVTFDISTFTHNIAVSRTNKSGEQLIWPEAGTTDNGNIGSSMELFVLHLGATQVMMHSNFAAMTVCTAIHTNVKNSRLSATLISIITTLKGNVALIQPIDFSKNSVKPATTQSCWHRAEASFQPTPFYTQFLANLKKLNKVNNKAASSFLVYIGGKWMASVTTSPWNFDCPANNFEMYVPENYNGPFEIWGSLSGNCYGQNARVSSLFYRLDGNELKTVGIRTLMQPHYSDSVGVMHSWGYPRFVRPAQDVRLADCTPVLTAFPFQNYRPTNKNSFDYTFSGRHGEDMYIDAFRLGNVRQPTGVADGLHETSNIKVIQDSVVVCKDRNSFTPGMDWKDAHYTIEISTENVLIGGSKPGKCSGVCDFTIGKGNNTIPSVSSLSIIDRDGRVTDTLPDPSGKLELTAGAFKYVKIDNGRNGYLDTYAPAKVTVEYALSGTDAFTALPAVYNAEYSGFIGYGNYYSCDMSNVRTKVDNSWYDLRIRVEDADGNFQTQVIAPAFYISSHAGVAMVDNSDNANIIPEYYTLSGLSIGNTMPTAKGIYIERRGKASRKIMVK